MFLKSIFLIVIMFGGNLTDATNVIDPWLIVERKAIIATLVNSTNIPALFGDDNVGNFLWGFEIQTIWQIESGRQQSIRSLARIDEFAWFAGINYQLTIVPYIVAMKCDLLPPTEFLPPQSNSPDKFPITYETIEPELARDWTNYFEAIKILRVDPAYMSPENLQEILWVAHNSTVINALPKFENELRLLNHQEERFANGFGHFIEVLAIMNFNTSYPPIYSLNQMFPQRVLRVWDIPPFILDMTPQQNAVVSAYFAIDAMTKVPSLWPLFITALQKAMATSCSVQIRQTFNNFLVAWDGGLIDLLLNALSNC